MVGLESEEVCYNAGYTNVHELIPWRTLTGRQQFYQDHRWMLDFGEGACVYKPAIDTKHRGADAGPQAQRQPEPGAELDHAAPEVGHPLHLLGQPPHAHALARRADRVDLRRPTPTRASGDNDWVEAYNVNGTLTARAVVVQRVPQGMCMMYHAQEKIVNVPGAEMSGMRGGIHNSVTRAVTKPTHMIGGYAQQAYGFNYYGTVGSQSR